MPCSTIKKHAVPAMAVTVLAIGVMGLWMMIGALHVEDADDFIPELFMQALGLMMLAVTLWIPLKPTLGAVIQCNKQKPRAKEESLLTKTGKMLAYQHKEAGQRA